MSTRTRKGYSRKKRLDEGKCVDCGLPRGENQWRCDQCMKANSASHCRAERQRHLEGRCVKCGCNAEKRLCQSCIGQSKLAGKHHRHRLLKEVIEHYSYGTMKCECCGEPQMMFLTLDHINGGGRQERLNLSKGKGGGGALLHHLRKMGFPVGYQVLCMNCNSGKYRNGGVCPHEANRGSSPT